MFRQQYCDQALYYIFSYNNHLQLPPPLNANHHHHHHEHRQQLATFDPHFILILTTIFLLLSLLILIIFLLKHINYFQIQDPFDRSYLSSSIRNVIFRTFHDNHLRLLLPMAFFIGLQQGFFMSDYNKASVFLVINLFIHLWACLWA